MGEILNTTGASGFEIWVFMPDFVGFGKEFPVCLQNLESFCALPQSQVKIFLLSENGKYSAMTLEQKFSKSDTWVLLCEFLSQDFDRPLLRRTAMDGESDYFRPTSGGFERLPQPECDALEKRVLSAICDLH